MSTNPSPLNQGGNEYDIARMLGQIFDDERKIRRARGLFELVKELWTKRGLRLSGETLKSDIEDLGLSSLLLVDYVASFDKEYFIGHFCRRPGDKEKGVYHFGDLIRESRFTIEDLSRQREERQRREYGGHWSCDIDAFYH